MEASHRLRYPETRETPLALTTLDHGATKTKARASRGLKSFRRRLNVGALMALLRGLGFAAFHQNRFNIDGDLDDVSDDDSASC
jgi:hypothetical protein